jgi:hypothetical protein
LLPFGNFFNSFSIFCGHLGSFEVIWYIFRRFGMLHPREIWQPCSKEVSKEEDIAAGRPDWATFYFVQSFLAKCSNSTNVWLILSTVKFMH